ncbi:2-dehydro-3-deoxy-6-phosphogalactonate aldolase [Sedimentitalea nanhaiensis]|uniref:2-keto-3-deoxy-phosphogalactonate aldolase n=1 Tax=Sedimentitalea nanhaiensis TaxID=999627 RepID=A0A1I7CKB3_9RHOB|nr:2-dehydro-3-deoxy-6-phosphogalactonate aldolase [Sedimentitalea nanhaiensis]SFT99824.1 2-keto-3-deoxy-phosphogalactonate aldolase [Sedimentitalea nanhaiensis]
MHREIVAILRGVRTTEVEAIGEVLIRSGITIIEVPLNSPSPIESIKRLAQSFGSVARIGAGTVLSVDDVHRVADAGGKLIVSPDVVPDVIEATKKAGLLSYPGALTPTECFRALRHGSDALKLFPSSLIGIDGLKALSAVLPTNVKTYAVGGVGPENFQAWLNAGVTGFGIGSAVFQPGFSSSETAMRAEKIVASYDNALKNKKLY